MGLADLVPGVSGGTIALISGIYQELIESLNRLQPNLLPLLWRKGVAVFWKEANGSFLASVFGGIISSVVLFSSLIQWLLAEHQIPLFSFFFGLLLSSLIFLQRHVAKWNGLHVGLVIAGTILAFASTQLVPATIVINPFYLFLCGFIAISAMILPGLSGAYILIVMGAYSHILQLVQDAVGLLQELHWEKALATFSALVVFILGIVTGLLTFSRVLRWFLKYYYSQSLAVLMGLMVGAIHKIWPWQLITEKVFGAKTKQFYSAVLPQDYPTNPQLIQAIFAFFAGIGILFAIEQLRKRTELS